MAPPQLAPDVRSHLIRAEGAYLIHHDRTTGRWDYLPSADLPAWTNRDDTQVMDYRCVYEPGSRHVAAPLSLFLDLTAACQCACWYCYNRSGRKLDDELTSAEIEALIRAHAAYGGVEVRLSGGEPTLHPDLLRFIELSAGFGLTTVLVSNGMIEPPLLAQLAHAPVSAFYLSLQGDRATHDAIRGAGSYDACVRSARTLAAASQRVRLSMTFHQRNQHCVDHVAAVAADIGAAAAFNPLRPVAGVSPDEMLDPQEHRALVERVVTLRAEHPQTRLDTPWAYLTAPPGPPDTSPYKRLGCGDGGLSVTAVGDCFTCGQLAADPAYCIGNVREDDMVTIWRRSRGVCPVVNAKLSGKCRQCAYLYGSPCFGGCVVSALAVNGAMDAGDPYCFVDLVEGARP
ncbi:MAG: radical SAM protein [Armatimonadetes bacterium]|nr:radical SAM protein [Armatimonadota bacterium]